jgi:hypothetical protein
MGQVRGHVYDRFAGMNYSIPTEPVPENPEGMGTSLGSKEQYKEKLLQDAVALGIPAKRTWGIDKLKRAIDGYGQ